jgi:ligand-binding sensor domain-containing protein
MRVSHDATVTAITPGFVVNPNAMLRTRTHLLVGTLSDGLWVETLATGKWQKVSKGLPSENVTAMAERDGFVYVGTEDGLVKIAEENLGQ